MLLIDAGNSRIKWMQAKASHEQGVLALNELQQLPQQFAALNSPQRIIISNVAGPQVAQQLRDACAAWPAVAEFISAQAKQCGVRNSYLVPSQLGSDRWAALIAAWQLQQSACLAINCGTATTIDALSANAEFIGGLIVPGLNMIRHSLASGTSQLLASGGQWQSFPRNSADAMYSGAIQASVGAIRQQYELLGESSAVCILSGGAAEQLLPHLGLPAKRVDNLVLQGLQIIGQDAAVAR